MCEKSRVAFKKNKSMKRVCTKCSEERDALFFRRRNAGKYNDHYLGICRKCEQAYNKIHRDEVQRKKRSKERFSEVLSDPVSHKKLLERNQRYRDEKKEKYRAYQRKHIKKQVDEISDSYILRAYFRTAKAAVPKELIEAYRTQLKLKRLIKEKSKCKT